MTKPLRIAVLAAAVLSVAPAWGASGHHRLAIGALALGASLAFLAGASLLFAPL